MSEWAKSNLQDAMIRHSRNEAARIERERIKSERENTERIENEIRFRKSHAKFQEGIDAAIQGMGASATMQWG